MKLAKIDIESAIEDGVLLDAVTSTARKNELATQIVESHRVRADAVVSEAGGTLRTDVTPEFYIRRGSDVLAGGDFLLTSSRWSAWVPENFDPQRASALTR